MAETVVRDWINEYKSLDEVETLSFSSTIVQNNDLIQAIFSVLEEKRHHQEFLEPVCEQLFSFYRSKEENFQRFTRQYIPCLIGIYLSHVAKGNRKNVRSIEVLLLGIYNWEVIDSSGKPITLSFRIPSVCKPSIYHEPMHLSHHTVLTEDALSNLEYVDCRKYVMGPFPEVEKINASNRQQVMTVLMSIYNQNIEFMSSYSHMSLCKMCTKVVKQGYNRTNRSNYSNDCSTQYCNPHPRPIARIPLSTSFLLELVHSVYFAMFNGVASAGMQSLEELHNRAVHEILPDVLLVTNAIKNSLKFNPSGQPSDGPMGISVLISSPTVISGVSRAITNASFRTKKLPDDIPIQTNGEAVEGHQLTAINEEDGSGGGEPSTPQIIVSSRSKKQLVNGSSGNPATSKNNPSQSRKERNKDKKRGGGDQSFTETNGKSSVPPSSSTHSNMASSDLNSDESYTNGFTNGEDIQMQNSFSCRVESMPKMSKSPSEGHRNYAMEGKCGFTFSDPELEASVENDVKYILGVHKSESANGIQSSSLQTAV